jgi:hypothetical protein
MEAMVMIADDNNGQNTSELYGGVGGVGGVIVGLNVALKGPFPLVGESELSRESEMSRNFWCDFTPNFFARNIKN